MFGPPGCGKGTQAQNLQKWFGISTISTGEMFRQEIRANSLLGREVAELMAAGALVPDTTVNRMVVRRLQQDDCRDGFLLDGYPRTVEQAKFLNHLLEATGYPQPVVIYIHTPAEAVIGRVESRRQCPACGRVYNVVSQPPKKSGVCDFDNTSLIQRRDDTAEVIRERLEAYRKLTGPVMDLYRGPRLHVVDGRGTPDEVFEAIKKEMLPELAAVGIQMESR
ncbi:MAG: adenylate kinase [Bryobacter sp.]|jgi:adenylate kinase|nr:adenylate kinase [Bryobacter sp.]